MSQRIGSVPADSAAASPGVRGVTTSDPQPTSAVPPSLVRSAVPGWATITATGVSESSSKTTVAPPIASQNNSRTLGAWLIRTG